MDDINKTRSVNLVLLWIVLSPSMCLLTRSNLEDTVEIVDLDFT